MEGARRTERGGNLRYALIAVLVAGTVMAPSATARPYDPDCKGYGAERTVRCAGARFGGTSQALAVWRCESGFGHEPPHSDPYHGPFQFLKRTFHHMRDSMPNVVRWFDLSNHVHNMRANIIVAVAWASRNGWGPWSCAVKGEGALGPEVQVLGC